jgi:hypothetical protein
MNTYKKYVEIIKIYDGLEIKDKSEIDDSTYEPTEWNIYYTKCPTTNNNSFFPSINKSNNINNISNKNNSDKNIIIITTTVSSVIVIILSYILYKLYYFKYKLNKKESCNNFGTELNQITDF